MFVRAGDVVEEVDAAGSAAAQRCAVAVELVWVEAEVTARQVADFAAAGLGVALRARLQCPDPMDCHPPLHLLVVAASQAGPRVCVLPMAICPHQARVPARDSAVGPAVRELQRGQAELDQALAFARRTKFDLASAHFQPMTRGLRLVTYRISLTCLRSEAEFQVLGARSRFQLARPADLPVARSLAAHPRLS